MRANKPAVMKYHIGSLVSGGFRLSLALDPIRTGGYVMLI